MRRSRGLLLGFLLCTVSAVVVPTVYGQTDPVDVLRELLTNPATLLIFLTQFGLGFGLGYFSVRALKYIVAILCLIIIGVLLNIWQFGGVEEFLQALQLPAGLPELTATVTAILSLLGILTLLPIGLGFFAGALTAAAK
jgi:hypothetical protein